MSRPILLGRMAGIFCFAGVFTDEGIYGVGEASGWPSIQTEIHHKASVIIGEDPFNIESILWSICTACRG